MPTRIKIQAHATILHNDIKFCYFDDVLEAYGVEHYSAAIVAARSCCYPSTRGGGGYRLMLSNI